MNACSWRGGIALLIDAVCLVQPLDQGQLVLHVHDLKQLRQSGVAVMRAQHAVAQPVKGADPHAARVHRRQCRQPQQHLLGRLVGEGNREQRQWARLTGRQQPRDPRSEHARLAAAGASENQRRAVRQGNCGELFRV